MILSILGVSFTPFAILIVNLILLIIYGIKALIERRRRKKYDKKRLKSLPVCRDCSSGRYNWHNFVDLGLPSRTLWATCNVGASAPNEPGLYFAWGSTVSDKKKMKNVYCIPRLDPQHDAATVHWGGLWRMPTKREVDELIYSCSFIAAKYNGSEGVMVIGPNQNTLFLPMTGIIYNGDKKPLTLSSYESWISEEKRNSEGRPLAYYLCVDYSGEAYDDRDCLKAHRMPVRPVLSGN